MVFFAVLGAQACLSGTDLVTPPAQPPTTITLIFRSDSEDAATAAALGWQNGIARPEVTIIPDDTTQLPRVLQASDSGRLLLQQVSGSYKINAERWLTDSERALLTPGDDAVGFIARGEVNSATATDHLNVEMVASRRHGIVISEWKGDDMFTAAEGTYSFSGYVRLYNNGDTTVYLDGLIIGSGLASQFDYPNYPCSMFAPYALDPRGIWARYFHQLPGGGTDYPLLPGATVVLATDAIDHRPLYPRGLDLRGANFEFYAAASDVDNPDVPNAVDIGVEPFPSGHGLSWTLLGAVAWVARPFDPATMQRQLLGDGRVWARVPANTLLDVFTKKSTYKAEYPECARLVDASFDRREVQLLGASLEDYFLAYRRRELPISMDGRPVLQHTRTSAWDVVVAPMTPFAKP